MLCTIRQCKAPRLYAWALLNTSDNNKLQAGQIDAPYIFLSRSIDSSLLSVSTCLCTHLYRCVTSTKKTPVQVVYSHACMLAGSCLFDIPQLCTLRRQRNLEPRHRIGAYDIKSPSVLVARALISCSLTKKCLNLWWSTYTARTDASSKTATPAAPIYAVCDACADCIKPLLNFSELQVLCWCLAHTDDIDVALASNRKTRAPFSGSRYNHDL